MQSVAEAGAWLGSLINLEQRSDWAFARVGLGPIRALLAKLGDPQRGLPAIHVAGSKGKGSTVLLAEALLVTAGVRTGAFVSPHLERWTERIRIAGREVDDATLVAAVTRIRPQVEALRASTPQDAPTFFDATTAAAFECFRATSVELALLEVGLGGRLDSTNVVEPDVTCITHIELEHTDKLGDTLAAIAGEKAGIVKPGVPVVVGALPEEAAAVVRARAAELDAPALWLGRDFGAEPVAGAPGRVRLWDGDFACEARLGPRGDHQLRNAALALACVRRCGALSDAALAEAAARALPEARLPGRCEVVGDAPLRVVDAAHTEGSARALARELRALAPGPFHFLVSISADKDAEALLAHWLPLASGVTLTRAEPHRSVPPERLAEPVRRLAPALPVAVVEDPEEASRRVGSAREDACAAGSVYLAGVARRVWRAASEVEDG